MARIFIMAAFLLGAVAPALAKTPQAAPAAKASNEAVPEKLICKRMLKTGTLAQFDRVCLTKAQWQRSSERQREFWMEQQGSKGSTNGR